MKIFIASSTEQLSTAKNIAKILEGLNCSPRLWNDGTIFRPGEQYFDSLRRVANEVDAALFLLMPDDRLWYRGKELGQPRDNVLLEYGVFAGRLGPKRCAVVTSAETNSPSDLAGLHKLVIVPDRRLHTESELEAWLDAIKRESPNVNASPAERMSGDWVGEGKETYTATGAELIDVGLDCKLSVQGGVWKAVVQVVPKQPRKQAVSKRGTAKQASKAAPPPADPPQAFELVGEGYLSAFGWLNFYYNNPHSALPNHGVFYVQYSGFPESLTGYYAGFSAARRTLVAGRLTFHRPCK